MLRQEEMNHNLSSCIKYFMYLRINLKSECLKIFSLRDWFKQLSKSNQFVNKLIYLSLKINVKINDSEEFNIISGA